LDRFSTDGLAVSIIAVAEIYKGAFRAPNPEEMLSSFREILASYPMLHLTDPIVERFARMRAALRQQGQLIPDMDLLIAATALTHDLILVTRNVRYFERIADLQLYELG
jgi:predicted nucleic acid-binding protein